MSRRSTGRRQGCVPAGRRDSSEIRHNAPRPPETPSPGVPSTLLVHSTPRLGIRRGIGAPCIMRLDPPSMPDRARCAGGASACEGAGRSRTTAANCRRARRRPRLRSEPPERQHNAGGRCRASAVRAPPPSAAPPAPSCDDPRPDIDRCYHGGDGRRHQADGRQQRTSSSPWSRRATRRVRRSC